jgi:hypothetical protein
MILVGILMNLVIAIIEFMSKMPICVIVAITPW